MKSKQKEFPHPLLSEYRNDFSAGSFVLSLTDQSNNDDFVFDCHYSLICPGIEKYIADGLAQVVIRVRSSATTYRNSAVFNPATKKVRITIPKQRVAKLIVFQAFIVTTTEIKGYSLPEHNQTYFKGSSYDLRKGDLLAESKIFQIKLDDSELEKPLSSIFQIKQNDAATDSLYPSFDSEKIIVFVSKRLYDIYYSLRKKGELRRYLSAVIVYPALIEALSKMQIDDSDGDGGNIDYSGKRWYQSIKHKLEKVQIDIEDTVLPLSTIANRLLGDIAWDALNTLKTTLDDINRNSETIESEWRD